MVLRKGAPSFRPLSCSLINALERGGQWQLAEKLFLSMCTVQVFWGGDEGVRVFSTGLADGPVTASGLRAAGRSTPGCAPQRACPICKPSPAQPNPAQPCPSACPQEEVKGTSSPQSLLVAAAHSPSGGKLLRAQTSPSSVLDVLQSPPGRGAGLPLVRCRKGSGREQCSVGKSGRAMCLAAAPHLTLAHQRLPNPTPACPANPIQPVRR